MEVSKRLADRVRRWTQVLVVTGLDLFGATGKPGFPWLGGGFQEREGWLRKRDAVIIPGMVVTAAVVTWVSVVSVGGGLGSDTLADAGDSCWRRFPLGVIAGFGRMVLTALQSAFWRRGVRPLWLPLPGGALAGVFAVLTYSSCWFIVLSGVVVSGLVYVSALVLATKLGRKP